MGDDSPQPRMGERLLGLSRGRREAGCATSGKPKSTELAGRERYTGPITRSCPGVQDQEQAVTG